MFRGPDEKMLKGIVNAGPRWVYIPLDDLAAYAAEVGRPFPERLKRAP